MVDYFVDNEKQVKECLGCGNILPFSLFTRLKEGLGGRTPRCKKCRQREHAARRIAKGLSSKPWPFCDTEKQLKECRGCNKILPFESFARRGQNKRSGRHTKCRKCDSIQIRCRAYKITPSQLESMIMQQNGDCAICKNTMDNPHVDHDHITGKVRGLLCSKCNTGLGLFVDDPVRLIRAAEYLSERY